MKKKEKKEICEPCNINSCEDIIAEAEMIEEIASTESRKPQTAKRQKTKATASERIYKFLDTAEKVATVLAKKQKAKKKKAKKQLKKDKKVGKIDKKTGAVVLKKVKKDKIQKPMKRYKPPKKK